MPVIAKPSKAILMDAVSREFRKFQYNPEPLEESIQVQYQEITAPAMSHPFYQYVGGQSDEIKIEIHLNDKGEAFGFTEDFIRFISRFRPARTSTTFSPPPPIILSYGPYRRTGLVISMQIVRQAFDTRTLQATKALITLSIRTLPV